ncbi:MAG: hypothetical protein QNJ94_20195 [Alphaproteobacteria bacterium]|nr:hypothetical protein [Alphaproteobacteria bacterium]
MPRSVPISVRVSDEDAAFLARYEAPGARTPSDKIRAIIASARRRYEGSKDFTDFSELMREMVRPSERAVREAQRQAGVRSDFVFRLYERLPEMIAELVAGAPDERALPEELRKFEGELADQVFLLFEEVLDLGLTTKSRSYDPNLMKARLEPILEIVELINLSRNRKKGAGK